MADDGQFLGAAGLRVQPVGGLRETGDPWMPFELVDADGGVVAPVAAYLRDVQACGRSEATLRSYGMDLLRWFRFCWASGLEWDQVTRSEAADFCRWLTVAGKPGSAGGYAPATAAHCETVLRHFYGFHLESGTGPMVNPFPLARGRGRAGAHRNPMDPFPRGRAGLFRPRLLQRAPRCIPDGQFGEPPSGAKTLDDTHTLAAEWHHTYDGKRPDLGRALEFYDRWLPGTMHRITNMTRKCVPQCVMLRGPGGRAAFPRYR